MEIQKIFSDEYDEERLYSVLMNEEELALFSELQKEFALKFIKKKLRDIGIYNNRGILNQAGRNDAAEYLKKVRKGSNEMMTKFGIERRNDFYTRHQKRARELCGL